MSVLRREGARQSQALQTLWQVVSASHNGQLGPISQHCNHRIVLTKHGNHLKQVKVHSQPQTSSWYRPVARQYGVSPNKRMQPTHQPGHQICMRKFVACLAGG